VAFLISSANSTEPPSSSPIFFSCLRGYDSFSKGSLDICVQRFSRSPSFQCPAPLPTRSPIALFSLRRRLLRVRPSRPSEGFWAAKGSSQCAIPLASQRPFFYVRGAPLFYLHYSKVLPQMRHLLTLFLLLLSYTFFGSQFQVSESGSPPPSVNFFLLRKVLRFVR